MARLSISLLGPFQATLHGQPVTGFESNRVRALLAYLAVEADSPHSRDRLAGLLWPEQSDKTAHDNLRQALANLRRAIGDHAALPPFLHIARDHVQFNTTSDYHLDVMSFTRLLAACEEHVHRNPETCRVCMQWLQDAASLYRGDFLEHFFPGGEGFEEWVLLQRERLHRLALDALYRLAGYHERRGAYEQAQRYAARQLALDPWREEAHRQLMRALALSGQRTAALAQYEKCRRILAGELGAEPAPDTIALYQQIRSGSFRVEHSASNLQPSNLPTPTTPFVGREEELAQLIGRLENPACRLLTLIGPGGIGKSRVALRVAENQIGSYLHGVYLVPLAGSESAEALPSTIITALGLELSSKSDPKQQLFTSLQDKEVLLVLDNFEHLLDGTGLLAAILRHAPRVTLLVTSRERLKLQSEWIFTVEGLPFPEADRAAGIEQYSAVTLFVQTAHRIRASFVLDETNKPFVARICRLVEGMPLAIELAAAWIPVLEPEGIANAVEGSLDILEADLHDLPERQRSMRAVFNASWKLLTAEEQVSIQRLSVFRGGFNLHAAENAFGISIKMIRALVNKCWVQPEMGGRFQLHELVRQYAFERLRAARGLWQSAGEDHSAYFCRYLKEREKNWDDRRQREVYSEIEADIQNIEAAWKWALDQSRLDLIGQALESLCNYYDWSGRIGAGEAASRTASECLDVISKQGGRDATDVLFVRVRALTWHGRFGDDYKVAFQEASAILGQLEDVGHDTRFEKAQLLLFEGVMGQWSDPHRAWQLCSQSLALYEALGDEAMKSAAVHWLGFIAWILGDFDQALSLCQQSLASYRSAGNPSGIAGSLDLLAKVFREKGQLEEAEQCNRESLALARELGLRIGEGEFLVNLAHTLICKGEFVEAQAQAQESLDRRNVISIPSPYSSYMLARALLHQGYYGQARVWATRGLEDALKFNDELTIGLALNCLGEIDLVENRLEEAMERLQESLAATQAHKQVILTGMPLANLAYTARALKRPDQARQYLRQCLEDAHSIGSFRLAIHALPAIALLEADQGKIERAIELYAFASKYPYVANSKWFEDVAGRHIASLAVALPSETVTTAQAHGISLEFWEAVKQWLVERNRILY